MSIEKEKGDCCETDYMNWCMANNVKIYKPPFSKHPVNDFFVGDEQELVNIKGQIPWWIQRAFTISCDQFKMYMKRDTPPKILFYDVDNLRIQYADLITLDKYIEFHYQKGQEKQACIPINKTTFVRNITDPWTIKEIIRLWGKEIQGNKKFKNQGVDYYAL